MTAADIVARRLERLGCEGVKNLVNLKGLGLAIGLMYAEPTLFIEMHLQQSERCRCTTQTLHAHQSSLAQPAYPHD